MQGIKYSKSVTHPYSINLISIIYHNLSDLENYGPSQTLTFVFLCMGECSYDYILFQAYQNKRNHCETTEDNET